MKRRNFLKTAAGAASASALGGFGFLRSLPTLLADNATLVPKRVEFDSEMEPLVRLLEETPRERVIEEIAARIAKGLSYRELLTAVFLAGARNIQPRPVGFKFHAVLVIHSAHLASINSPPQDRWLPLMWAVDQFKSSQAADVREGNWDMSPVDESAVPPPHRAKQALIDAMDQWDESAADAAIVGMVRSAGAYEIFETLAPYGARDFREIGHKEIYLANSFRALETIGWRYAEPILRSVVYAMLDRVGDKVNPSKADLPADRPYRKNLERIASIKPSWLEGRPTPSIVGEFLEVVRQGSAIDTSEKVVEYLNRGVAPSTLFDAFFLSAGELLMRNPGIISIHATTFTNAVHYAFQHTHSETVRKLLLLQNAAFLPLFRGQPQSKGVRIDTFASSLDKNPTNAPPEVEAIFANLKEDRLGAAHKVMQYLNHQANPKPFVDAARRLLFAKGRDSHDYKFTSAVWEEYQTLSPGVREPYLAASVFNLKGTQDTDNDLVQRIRSALGS